jgi:O-antigen ligase
MALALLLPLWRHRIVWHFELEAVYFELHDIIVDASDLLVLLVVAVWLLSPARKRVAELPRWLVILLAAMAMLATLSATWATLPWLALYHAARLWVLFLLFLAVATTREARWALTWGLLISAAVQAGLGLAQFAAQGPLGLRDLGEVAMPPAWSGASVITVAGERFLRPYGLTQHPNLLGGFLMVGCLIGAGLVLAPRRARWPAAAAITLTAVSFAGLLLSFSRSAWAAAAVGGAAMLLLLLPRAGRASVSPASFAGLFAALSMVAILFVATQWPLLRPRLGLATEGVEIRSVDERAGLEGGARALIAAQPWLGVGYANFSVALWEARPPALEAYPTFQPVHNVPLLARAELGPVGAALWCALAVGPWAAVIVARRRWPSGVCPRPVAAAALGGVTGLVVVGCFDFYPWFSQQGRMMMWVLWALLAQSLAHGRSPVSETPAGAETRFLQGGKETR